MDLVQWLVEHPGERDQMTGIVDLFVQASSDLIESVPEQRRESLKARILDHLWCDLIAAIVCAIEQVEHLETIAKDELARFVALTATELVTSARICSSYHPSSRKNPGSRTMKAELDAEAGLSMDSAPIQGCIRGVVKLALDSATDGFDAHRTMILTKLRIAAVMLCPDVVAHVAVWRHCWLPLVSASLFDAALNRFFDVVAVLKADLQTAPS